MHLADELPYAAARLPHENCVARRYKEWGMRWNARPLRLWSTDCRIRNGTYPSLVLPMTSDWNLKIWRLKMIQVCIYIELNCQRNAVAP
jgi:hypothetical protein